MLEFWQNFGIAITGTITIILATYIIMREKEFNYIHDRIDQLEKYDSIIIRNVRMEARIRKLEELVARASEQE